MSESREKYPTTPEIQNPDPLLEEGYVWAYKPNSNERFSGRIAGTRGLVDGWAWVYKPNSNERIAARVYRYGSCRR